jgi:hypothetical protein
MKKLFQFLLLTGVAAYMSSCKEDDTTNPPNPNQNNNTMQKIGEAYLSGAAAKAIVYADKLAETGYNIFYVELLDSASGSRLNGGKLTLNPLMDMGMMKHGTPIENTSATAPENGYYKVPVYFIMAGSASQWSLKMSFENSANGKTGNGEFGFEVKAPVVSTIKSTVLSSDSNAKVFISLVKPVKPIVGINDFEIVLHKKVSDMSFPPIDNYTVEITPEMPSMGHGSPNNVNPVLTALGHYVGKVNFTMTGLWRIHLKLKKDGQVISDDQYFDITLP